MPGVTLRSKSKLLKKSCISLFYVFLLYLYLIKKSDHLLLICLALPARERPWSAISIPDDQPALLAPPRKSPSSIMSFNSNPLSKSLSINNIAGSVLLLAENIQMFLDLIFKLLIKLHVCFIAFSWITARFHLF